MLVAIVTEFGLLTISNKSYLVKKCVQAWKRKRKINFWPIKCFRGSKCVLPTFQILLINCGNFIFYINFVFTVDNPK